MGDEILKRHVLAFADRNVWIAAYAAWYQHFLAMQPCPDHIATSWAREMTEASLVAFHQRDDQDQIRRAALLVPAPTPAPAPVPAPASVAVGPLRTARPGKIDSPSKKLAQISLFS
ncbi:MAG: hypothetical protein ACYCY2_00450 [Acidithiobacillus ferriphilus]